MNENYHWVMKSETGTQYTSPQKQTGELVLPTTPTTHSPTPLSPRRMGNNPFRITPAKTPRSKRSFELVENVTADPLSPVSLAPPPHKVRTIEELWEEDTNRKKQEAMRKTAEHIAHVISPETIFSAYATAKQIAADYANAQTIKFILRPAVTKALCDPDKKFLNYIYRRGNIDNNTTVKRLLDNIELCSGNLPCSHKDDPYGYIYERTLNSNIYKAFLFFDADSRDISNAQDWEPHPLIAKVSQYIAGEIEVEAPATAISLKPPVPAPTAFFTPTIEQWKERFDSIRANIRGGIIALAEKPETITDKAIEEFMKAQMTLLVQFRDEIKPGKKEINGIILAINGYINFLDDRMNRAKRLCTTPVELAKALHQILVNNETPKEQPVI